MKLKYLCLFTFGFFIFLLNVGAYKAPVDITQMDIYDLQKAMDNGYLSSELLVNLYLERKRLLEDDSPKNKVLGSLGLGYIMTLMLVVLLTMTIGIEKIIIIVPADIIPLLLITSTSVFSFLSKKLYERTHELKEIKKFSK